MVIKI